MNITELQSLADKIELLKKNPQMNYSNVYLLCKLLNTQFLAPRVKRLFKQSIRLTFADAQQLGQFLIEIIPGGLVHE